MSGLLVESEIQRKALELAAAVDARLAGEAIAAEGALDAAVEKYHEPSRKGLTEEQIFEMMSLLGESDERAHCIGERLGLTSDEIVQWGRAFVRDCYGQGWPNMRKALESRGGPGIDLDDRLPSGTKAPAPIWRKQWRLLWLWMQFYDDPKMCADEWSEHRHERSTDWLLSGDAE